MLNYVSQFVLPNTWVECGTNRNENLMFEFDFNAHHMPIFHCLATMHTAVDRLSDWNMLTMQHVVT